MLNCLISLFSDVISINMYTTARVRTRDKNRKFESEKWRQMQNKGEIQAREIEIERGGGGERQNDTLHI